MINKILRHIEKNNLLNQPKLLYVIFILGALWHLLSLTRDIVIPLSPYVLLAVGILIIFDHYRNHHEYNFLIWVGAVYLLTLASEIIGVNTGLIFGDYSYGDVLGIKLWGVPLLIGMNWVFVVFGARVITEFMPYREIIKLVTAAGLTVLFDALLEPIAIKLGYWSWAGGDIPLYNYLSWFLLALICLALGKALKITPTSALAWHNFFAQSLFFILLLLFLP